MGHSNFEITSLACDFQFKNALKPQFKHLSFIVFMYTKNRKTAPGRRTPKRFALF